jgi:biotin carboxylase
VPHFQAFNPFDADALEKIEIAYPFWIKPVKSFGSYLGFRINSREDWEHAIPIIREHIGKISTPFDFLLNQIEMPKEVAEIGGVSCIAESIISGHQVTLEGFAHNGRVQTYGIVDSLREANGSTFSRYQYPSTLPQAIQEEMRDIAVALMAFINFDNSAFNVEFFYDESRNKIWLLEVNPRISQSHGFLFYNVDGAPNHRIIIDLALGRHPNFPHRQGKYAYAAKFMHRLHQDAILEHAPDQVALEKIYQQYPNVEIDLHVQTGTRLSELRNQDSYSFDLADIYIGGDSVEALERDYQAVVNQMDFQFSLPQPEQLSAVEER